LRAIFVFRAGAGSDLDVVVDDGEFAALILKRLGDGVELALNLRNLMIDLADIGFDAFER